MTLDSTRTLMWLRRGPGHAHPEGAAGAREAYLDRCRERLRAERRAVAGDLGQVRGELAQVEERFVSLLRRQEALARRRFGLRRLGESGALARYAQEYDMLLATRKVEEVALSERSLRARTAPISLRYSGRDYPLGRFLITVDLAGGSTRIHSAERAGGYPHPHVSQNGDPCLGNLGVAVAKLVAGHQYGTLVGVLVGFLESYNPDNPYRALESFPARGEGE